MATPPTTKPETWLPAGAEPGTEHAASHADAPASERTEERRRPEVTLPPKESLQPRSHRLGGLRKAFKGLRWSVVGAALPWTWFLVRDLGPAMQLVALALPVLVIAAILGLLIAAADERKLTTLITVGSVAIFGWVTVMGPKTAQPGRPATDTVRVATINLPGEGPKVEAIVAALHKAHADVAVLVVPAKKHRTAIAGSDAFGSTVLDGRFVVVSDFPMEALPLPKSLPSGPLLRVQVDRPDGAFVLYAVHADDTLQGAMEDPLNLARLQAAALSESLPVVLAGGFGFSDRSTDYRTLDENFRDAMRSGTEAERTVLGPLWLVLLLRTDYVFTSRAWCAENGSTFDVPTAEHAALVASVGPCRP
jgi:endonuclease/exonuclease/phosphatase family metal-dependent hydrolase